MAPNVCRTQGSTTTAQTSQLRVCLRVLHALHQHNAFLAQSVFTLAQQTAFCAHRIFHSVWSATNPQEQFVLSVKWGTVSTPRQMPVSKHCALTQTASTVLIRTLSARTVSLALWLLAEAAKAYAEMAWS